MLDPMPGKLPEGRLGFMTAVMSAAMASFEKELAPLSMRLRDFQKAIEKLRLAFPQARSRYLSQERRRQNVRRLSARRRTGRG